MLRISAFVFGCCLLLTGCAKSTVVLLPDEDGVTGAVLVQAGGEQCVLAEAAQCVEARSGGLSARSSMPREEVDKVFGAALKALPIKAESVLIYFTSESTQPTEESVQQLTHAVALYRAHMTSRVELFGHTDTLGECAYNQDLSVARAKEVRRLLISQGIAAEKIHAQGFGDRDPLVPQRPGHAEPRNRRVEIFIR